MILKRFYDEPLAQASYLLGDTDTHEAIVVDPNRDVDAYLDAAQASGLATVAVTETHVHADYVSGTRELARRANAEACLSDEGGPDWRYAWADEPRVRVPKTDTHIFSLPLGGRGKTPAFQHFQLTDNEPRFELAAHAMRCISRHRNKWPQRCGHLSHKRRKTALLLLSREVLAGPRGVHLPRIGLFLRAGRQFFLLVAPWQSQ